MSLEKAIDVAEEAIGFDNLEKDYEAIEKYIEAVELLKDAHKDPENADNYDLIFEKITEYEDRIKYLADFHPGDPKFIALINPSAARQPPPALPPKTYQTSLPTTVKSPEPELQPEPVVQQTFPPMQQSFVPPPKEKTPEPEPEPIVQPPKPQPALPPKKQEPMLPPKPQAPETSVPAMVVPPTEFPKPKSPEIMVEVKTEEQFPSMGSSEGVKPSEMANEPPIILPKTISEEPENKPMEMPTINGPTNVTVVDANQQPPMNPMGGQMDPNQMNQMMQMMSMMQMSGMNPNQMDMNQMMQMMSMMNSMNPQMSQQMNQTNPMYSVNPQMNQQMNPMYSVNPQMNNMNMMNQSQPAFPRFGANQTYSTTGSSSIAPISSTQQQQPQQRVPQQSTRASRTAAIRHKLAIEHPTKVNGLRAWKLATSLAEKGKVFDTETRYADALAYYETSLDYYEQALRTPELTDTMKKQLRTEIKEYLARTEKIKPVVLEFLAQNPNYFGDVSLEESNRLETCIVCNKTIEGEFVAALGFHYHPPCFVQNVTCKLCGKPFQYPKMEYKIYNEQAYHPLCFEGVVCLEKEETYKPTMQKGTIFVKVRMPKTIFTVNESFMYDITIDNSTSCVINYIECGLVCEETRFSRGFSGEMKGSTSKSELAKKKVLFEGGAMKNGVVNKSEMFSIGMVRPSHHNDTMFYRGYRFVVSLKVSGVMSGPKDIEYKIYINEQ